MAKKMIDRTFRISDHVKMAKRLEAMSDEIGKLRNDWFEIVVPGSPAVNAEEKLGQAQGSLNSARTWLLGGIGDLYVDGDGKDEVEYEVEDFSEAE